MVRLIYCLMSNQWAEPTTTKSQVNKAGKYVAKSSPDSPDYDASIDTINNYRRAHSFPLNTIQMTLRRNAGLIDIDSIVAQRIKRLPSITKKLRLKPHIGLSAMQDIGGCRAIVSGVGELEALVDACRSSRWGHELLTVDDYVRELPRMSGYRSIHLVYSYNGGSASKWNGLKIEIQLRTRLQHSWATAVETVDTFERQDLKSGRGEPRWQRFFALMSGEFASQEDMPQPPGLPATREERLEEIRALDHELRIGLKLSAYGLVMESLGNSEERHHLLELDLQPDQPTLDIKSFSRLRTATEAYATRERETVGNDDIDVVLVSVKSMAALRRAYPNYFADTAAFTGALIDITDA